VNNSQSRLTSISFGWNLVFMVVLVATAFLVIVPMAFVVIISFSSKASIAAKGYSLIPAGWTLEGYYYLFKTGMQLMRSYLVSIEYAVLGTLSSLFVMSTFAYVLAQKTFVARRFLTWLMFIPMLFGGGLIPNYILMTRYLHIANTFWIFILPGLCSGGSVIMLRTFIKTSIPDALMDSARIDGAGHFRVYATIVTPLLKAGLATLALFSFVGKWNDWFTGLLYNDNPWLIPLQTMLYKLMNNMNFIRDNASMARTPDAIAILKSLPADNLRMACTVAVVLPVLLAYPFFQRYFVKGMLVGSIKE